MSFLALDATLGWKVKKYDGSWREWGNLSDEEGTLASDSPWRTNKATYTQAMNESVSTNGGTTCIPGYGCIVPIGCSYAAAADRTNENDKAICGSGGVCIDNNPCVGDGCSQTYDCKGYLQ